MDRRGLGLLLWLSAAAACGDRPEPAPAAKPTADATPSEAPADASASAAEPAPSTTPPPSEGPGEGVVAFTLDGAPRRFTVLEPQHATMNLLLTPPAITVIARADRATKETLTLKIGGVALDGATPPIELRGLPHEAGAPVVTMTYVDAEGARHEARVDAAAPDTAVTIDAWDPATRRLRGRFSADTKGAAGAAHQLRDGAFEAILVDPFAARPNPAG